MDGPPIIDWVLSSLLLSLRISPVFAFAPPFSLTRVPAVFRVFFGLSTAACLSAAYPQAAAVVDYSAANLALLAVRELMLGSVFVLAFQLMFAALYLAGRTVDIQAGYGLAMLIDPTTRSQTPLVGTILAYGAGAVFFAMNGHADLLRILGASVEAIPLGSWHMPTSLAPLLGFMSAVFLTAFGVTGGVILALFLADMAIAALARTAPQMNALVLGFQVKTILLLTVLPVTLGGVGGLLAKMAVITLEAAPRLL